LVVNPYYGLVVSTYLTLACGQEILFFSLKFNDITKQKCWNMLMLGLYLLCQKSLGSGLEDWLWQTIKPSEKIGSTVDKSADSPSHLLICVLD